MEIVSLKTQRPILWPTLTLVFISLAIRFFCLGSHSLLVEEAYYWNYAQHLDFGYLDHPPMVALLIKFSTILFGTNEFGVRFMALVCWLIAAIFCYKLSELIREGSGRFSVLLLAILPFFFLQSLMITPDQPLLACWSAALYALYRALVLNESQSWYGAGICIGLGLISKYTIVLLAPAILFYVIIEPKARYWFFRKEPYLAVLIATLFFMPVIYWNATHDWASFIFQTSRRFNGISRFSLHAFLGVVLLFLLPTGMIGLAKLCSKKVLIDPPLPRPELRFLQIFTLFPLIFFGVYSLTHPIKLDWIGAGLIAVLPWLAILAQTNTTYRKSWWLGGGFLLLIYSSILWVLSLGTPLILSKTYLQKFIDWNQLTSQFHDIASKVAVETNTTPIFVPLDQYNIGSELLFYQSKQLKHQQITQIYDIVGSQVFGKESLMYRYWTKDVDVSDKTIIAISTVLSDFNYDKLEQLGRVGSPLHILWAKNQGKGFMTIPYYYMVLALHH